MLKVALFQELMQCDLKSYLVKKKGSLRICDKKKILLEISNGLKFLRSLGIVHCDLKTQNVLMNFLNEAYLSDLGSVREMNLSASILSITKNHSAPEIFDFKPVLESDIYSFGCIM
jgi:serine/threonine protein kinase